VEETGRGVSSNKRVVFTLGYGGREPREFISLIRSFKIGLVIDVRRWPSSKALKFYEKDNLKSVLRSIGVNYVWLGEKLGGYRRFGVDIDDDGTARCFRSKGFSAYAQYMLRSPLAREGLARVESETLGRKTIILCKEVRPWACHRKLISDWLVYRGFRVVHIISSKAQVEHKLTRCARIDENGALRYY
jgi:uncharacterized protein (DUF488 family)